MKQLVIISFFILFIFATNAQNENINTLLNEINSDSLKKTVMDMQAFSTRFCLDNNKQVAQYIIDRLKSYDIENAYIDSFYLNNQSPNFSYCMYNVKATLHGNAPNDSTIIIGAHLDAYNGDSSLYSPGANDNASGIAIMLEMVRIFHTYHIIPSKNIDFMAFDGEEAVLKGSSYDAQNRKNRNEPVILMMNNDMVGYQPDSLDYKIRLIKYPQSIDITPIAETICNNFTFIKPYSSKECDYYMSDSYSYYMTGYNCFFSIAFYKDPHSHSSEDKFEYLNFDYMKEVAKLNFALLYHFSIKNLITYDTTTICSYNSPLTSIDIYPNPTSNKTEIQFILDQTSDINITFFDIMGKPVLQIPNQTYSSGKHEINIDCRKFEAGIYFCTLETQQNKKTIKLLIK